jgi:hypothetical protein
VAARKAFLLRLDPALWVALERLAQHELRSVNAEIEYLLREALAQRGVRPATPGLPPADPPAGPSADGAG